MICHSHIECIKCVWSMKSVLIEHTFIQMSNTDKLLIIDNFPRTHLVLLKMTTFRQSEYEELTQQIREEEQKRRGGNKSGNSDLKTSKTMASPKNMLTDKELQCVTAVFRSFETGLRGATINPCVS